MQYDKSENFDGSLIGVARRVLEIEANAIFRLAAELPQDFAPLIEKIARMEGKLVISGIGKSGHIGRKISSTLSSTGTPSCFLHGSEASHGDLGIIQKNDVCLLISNSGETGELSDLIQYTRRYDIPLASITSSESSTLALASNFRLVLPDHEEACHIGMAPTTSTTLTLALGDALAVALMRVKKFNEENFKRYHPGGKLGSNLLKVRDLMRVKEEITVVSEDSSMSDTVLAMTSTGFGSAVVVNEVNSILGVITDGDLRRNMDDIFSKSVTDIYSKNPATISEDSWITDALQLMQAEKIYSLLVEDKGKLTGMLRMHDLLKVGIL
jgi:arabinose-5-phosphate isomerase